MKFNGSLVREIVTSYKQFPNIEKIKTILRKYKIRFKKIHNTSPCCYVQHDTVYLLHQNSSITTIIVE